MKDYTVQVFSHEVNVKAEYETFGRAYEMYFKAMYSGGYERGHLMDANTGEILAHFSRNDSHGNWSINQYFSREIIPEVIKTEVYHR